MLDWAACLDDDQTWPRAPPARRLQNVLGDAGASALASAVRDEEMAASSFLGENINARDGAPRA